MIRVRTWRLVRPIVVMNRGRPPSTVARPTEIYRAPATRVRAETLGKYMLARAGHFQRRRPVFGTSQWPPRLTDGLANCQVSGRAVAFSDPSRV